MHDGIFTMVVAGLKTCRHNNYIMQLAAHLLHHKFLVKMMASSGLRMIAYGRWKAFPERIIRECNWNIYRLRACHIASGYTLQVATKFYKQERANYNLIISNFKGLIEMLKI